MTIQMKALYLSFHIMLFVSHNFEKMKFGNLVETCLWPHLVVKGLNKTNRLPQFGKYFFQRKKLFRIKTLSPSSMSISGHRHLHNTDTTLLKALLLVSNSIQTYLSLILTLGSVPLVFLLRRLNCDKLF